MTEGKCQDSRLELGYCRFLPNPIQSLLTYHPIIQSYIDLVTEKSFKMKFKLLLLLPGAGVAQAV
jgi:hypothetical protein